MLRKEHAICAAALMSVVTALPAGCYSSTAATGSSGPDAGADTSRLVDRRVCEADADCRRGETCVRFPGQPERLCAQPCPQQYLRCEGEWLICAAVEDPVTAGADGFCYPGASAPGVTCRSRFDCAAGLVCSRRGPFLDGDCADLYCESSVDCPEGLVCRFGGCHPVCDEREPSACPTGTVCWEGQCQPEEVGCGSTPAGGFTGISIT